MTKTQRAEFAADLKQMMADWDRATSQQREEALAISKRAVEQGG